MTTTFISLYITYFWIESIYLLSINCKGKQNKENFELQKPVVDNNNAMNDDNNPNIAFPIWTPRVRTGSLPTKIGLRCSVTDNGGNCVKYDSCFVTLTHNVTLLLYYVAGQMSCLLSHRPCGPGPCCPWSWCRTSGTHHACPPPRTWNSNIANVDEGKYRYLLYATLDSK